MLCDLWAAAQQAVHGIFLSRILEWVDNSYFRGSFQSMDWTCVSCFEEIHTGGFFTTEPPKKPLAPIKFSSVQSLSHVWLFVNPWTAACQPSLSITNTEFTQTHIHCISDTIQPSHPLSSPSPPTFNFPQHQGRFKWVSSSHQVAKILEFQLQHQPSQWIFRTYLL